MHDTMLVDPYMHSVKFLLMVCIRTVWSYGIYAHIYMEHMRFFPFFYIADMRIVLTFRRLGTDNAQNSDC